MTRNARKLSKSHVMAKVKHKIRLIKRNYACHSKIKAHASWKHRYNTQIFSNAGYFT